MFANSQKRILITQDINETTYLAEKLAAAGMEVVRMPLEIYFSIDEVLDSDQLSEEIDNADHIVFGSVLAARFFMQLYGQDETLEQMRKKVNLAIDKPTSDYLETFQIPAISAYPKTKPIDLIELMLRLGLLGRSLYPCGRHFSEELPGLFIELDIPCHEIPVYDRKGPDEEELKHYRELIKIQPPDYLLFHSIDSVRRTKIAFPELDFNKVNAISLHESVTRKLQDNGISVVLEWNTGEIDALLQLKG